MLYNVVYYKDFVPICGFTINLNFNSLLEHFDDPFESFFVKDYLVLGGCVPDFNNVDICSNDNDVILHINIENYDLFHFVSRLLRLRS